MRDEIRLQESVEILKSKEDERRRIREGEMRLAIRRLFARTIMY